MHAVVLVEWALGTLLVLGIARRAALVGTIVVLGMYSLFIARLLLLDVPVSCGCGFDSVISNLSHESQLAIGIVRNCFLMICAIVSLSVRPRITKKIGERHVTE